MHNTLILNFYVQFDTVLWSLFCFFPHTPFKGASNVANGLSCTLWWDWWKGLQLALCSSVLPTELSCSLTPGNRKPISAVEHNALLMYLSKCFMPVQKKKSSFVTDLYAFQDSEEKRTGSIWRLIFQPLL